MNDDSVKHVPIRAEMEIDLDAIRSMERGTIIDYEKLPNLVYEIDLDAPTMFSMVNGAMINPAK